ncbi:Hypothetical protein D9617_116g062170 [Elsinoe fawcettii]|nr:Hypothetical protein D9617_116g062170 [Elsinoe fawcettii]
MSTILDGNFDFNARKHKRRRCGSLSAEPNHTQPLLQTHTPAQTLFLGENKMRESPKSITDGDGDRESSVRQSTTNTDPNVFISIDVQQQQNITVRCGNSIVVDVKQWKEA